MKVEDAGIIEGSPAGEQRKLPVETEFRSLDIAKRRTKRQLAVLICGGLLLVCEFFWIGRVFYVELNTPTLQLQAMRRLFRYAVAPNTQRKRLNREALKYNIIIWPDKGIELERGAPDFVEKMTKVLAANYPEEYNGLPAKSKMLLLSYTLPGIGRDIAQRMTRSKYLDTSNASRHYADVEMLLENIVEHVGFSRYRWHGFDKSLYFILVHEQHRDGFQVFFASISDIADKSHLLLALLSPVIALSATIAGFLIINISGYRRQKRVHRLQTEIRHSNSWQRLIEALYEELSRFSVNSCSLQLLHEDSFSLISIGGKENPGGFAHILDLPRDSVTARRLEKIRSGKIDFFEMKNRHGENKEPYSLSIPLVKGERTLAFVNLNFSKSPTFRVSQYFQYLVNDVLSTIWETFETIFITLEEKRENYLEHFHQWLFNQRDMSPANLFSDLLKKIESDSMKGLEFLPPVRAVFGFGWKDYRPVEFFPGTGHPQPPMDFDLIRIIEKAEGSAGPQLNSRKPQLISAFPSPEGAAYSASFFLVEFQPGVRLTQLTLDYYQKILGEFCRRLNLYSSDVSRTIAYEKAVGVATGLQPEVKELLFDRVERYFRTPGKSLLSREEIAFDIDRIMRKEDRFAARGYGMLVELDLYKSTVFKKSFDNPNQHKQYEHAIEKINDSLLRCFRRGSDKFVTPNPAGGDGEGLRFFVTDLNTRESKGRLISKGQPITEEEKNYYNRKLVQSLLEMLRLTYLMGTPFKLGGLILDLDDPMQLSFKRGALKIHSYLNGYVERARFEKGNRIAKSGREELEVSLNFQSTEIEFVVSPKKIYQPWTVVVPASILPIVEEEAGKYGCAYKTFHTLNYLSAEPGNLSEYIEIKPDFAFPYHRFVPFLSRMPISWTLEIARKAVDELAEFYKSEKRRYGDNGLKTLLRDFCRSATEPLDLAELKNLLDPAIEDIRLPGLYMVLKKKSIFDAPLNTLPDRLRNISGELLPQLEVALEYGSRLTEAEADYEDIDANWNSRHLSAIVDIFREYLGKSRLI